jgi:hypothetical protein
VRNTSSMGNLTLYGTALFVSTIYARRASLLITVKRRRSRGYLNFNFFLLWKNILAKKLLLVKSACFGLSRFFLVFLAVAVRGCVKL